MDRIETRKETAVNPTFIVLAMLTVLPPAEYFEQYPGQHQEGLLEGLVVVIDAGHGGADPGTHATWNGARVYESAYAADIAARVTRLATAEGATVLATTDLPEIQDNDGVLPRDYFRSYPDGIGVQATREGLRRRSMFATASMRANTERGMVFLSVHLDYAAASLTGAHIIAPPAGSPIPRVVRALETAFRDRGMLRSRYGIEHFPIVRSGDERHGVKNILVMRPEENPIEERAYLELLNLRNPADLARVCSPEGREDLARAIVEGLSAFHFHTPEPPVAAVTAASP